MTRSIAALIMAAGYASRFGRCKQLTQVGGKALLQHSIDSAQAVCPGKVFAVSGAWHEALRKAMHSEELRNVILIYHPDWSEGLGSSIARGVTGIGSHVDGILVLLADQIAVTAEDLLPLRRKFTGDNIVCSVYAGSRGVPAIFGRSSFGKLRELSGDRGAKALLYDEHVPVVECPLDHASIDVDTPEDLHRWVTTRDHAYGLEARRKCV
ncbi:MAG: nucleotidyltransferase family protein [Nitrospirales bacterium]|nr:nucleotidyltransferase family protein [Nitrospira sp.]MDR4501520.1 nucleotidyltransferase family protein [Nitrospirales bacterium]